MLSLETETAYAQAIQKSLLASGHTELQFAVNTETSRNAASCMTALICHRLSSSGNVTELIRQTTFKWGDGILNIRNAVKDHHWTNLRLSFMTKFESETSGLQTAFLMLAWSPGESFCHAWAVPGVLVRNAMPRFAVGEIADKRTVRISATRHVFENCTESPDLKPYYAQVNWSPAELKFLTAAVTAEEGVRANKKDTGEAEPIFRETIVRYYEQKIVFLSPKDKAAYFIESVDESGCSVRRLNGEPARVTFRSYETKKELVKQQGRIARRGQLDNTVARHMCYLQSPELGLSPDNQEVVYLGDTAAAVQHFIQQIQALSSPKLYKPAILLVVLDGIEAGELDANCISFDWLLTRFHARLQKIGLDVGEQQLAEGFERLANDLFWLLAYHDVSAIDTSSKPSAKHIRETVAYAVIKEPYWASLQNPAQLSRVREAVLQKWPDLRDSSEPPPVIDESDAMRSLIDRIRAKGFVFQPWQIAAYVTAIRTKPFVILAGVSGTGKSKLPMLVAELTGAVTPRRIAVRPDWTDSSDVIGYVDLQNQFRPGVVLQAMREASMNQQRFHVCLIDEMNLARVEHYFAEFLSAIEDRRPSEGGGFESSPLIAQQLSSDSDEWGDQTIPRNLAIVGTVNMDESTHGFSRKVLDRAFTIELSEIDLAGGLTKSGDARPEAALQEWPISNWMCPASRLDEVDFNDPLNQKDIQRTVETLQRVNEVLVHAQLQVGYRTRDEIALFAINARTVTSAFVTNEGARVDPLDLALMMKVLPRIAGGSNSVRRVLLGLLGIATNGSPLSADADPSDLIESWERESRPGAFSTGRFPRTASRLCLMWNRLEVEGYTSYWL